MRTRLERTCLTCGKTFWIKPSRLKYYNGAGKYCSQPCLNKARVAAHRDKPTNDRFGRTSRKDDLIWKEAVRSRDGYICQRCGTKEGVMHAHHVATRKLRPDLKHDLSNGKTLCNSCHNWVHTHIQESIDAGLLSEGVYT